MLCPVCLNKPTLLPCPECQGFGIVHCCDGLRACSEEDSPTAPDAEEDPPCATTSPAT